MEAWERFRSDAKRDVAAAHVLYENENYGNAAFHCQQALEKMIKAVVLKDGTLHVTAQGMGHIPFKKIYESQLPRDYEKQWRDNRIVDDGSDLTYIFVLNTMRSDGFLRILLWKLSLNIPLPEVPNDYYYVPPEYQEPYAITLVPDSKLQLQRYTPSSAEPPGEETEPVEFVFTSFYLDQYQWRRQNAKKTRQDDSPLAAVLSFLDLYLIAYPHEVLGRYSIEIDGTGDDADDSVDTNSYELYKMQKFELKKLIDEITSAVTELDEKITYA